ncbi:MAG: flagellar FlbD family protein [Leptolinea sp.]|jgi:flagellar protein FlbD|nr:flagellar FlbD family protein [Leptolinea sp.]
MISLTRLNGSKYYLNADLIMSVEGTPDTVITLTNGAKFVVKNRPEEIIKMVVQYQRQVHNPEPEMESQRGE